MLKVLILIFFFSRSFNAYFCIDNCYRPDVSQFSPITAPLRSRRPLASDLSRSGVRDQN